jgi:hypothetical protein
VDRHWQAAFNSKSVFPQETAKSFFAVNLKSLQLMRFVAVTLKISLNNTALGQVYYGFTYVYS